VAKGAIEEALECAEKDHEGESSSTRGEFACEVLSG
jgi:hypothetical protein